MFINEETINFLTHMILHFDESGGLIRGQNPGIKHLLLEVLRFPQRNDMPQGSMYLEFLSCLVRVVESRWRVPNGATSSDGRVVQRLSRFNIGGTPISNTCCRDFPCSMGVSRCAGRKVCWGSMICEEDLVSIASPHWRALFF